MAKEKKRFKPDTMNVVLDMTPIIDVVFNLVIFFMIINDMSQKELEYLTLPRASKAEEDKGDDKERLVINIIDPTTPLHLHRIQTGQMDGKKPPVFFEGKQMADLDELRARLMLKANPRLYPDMTKPPVNGTLRPSRKAVLVRCDQGQIFGWVQAVMQFCTFVPGRDQKSELEKSPLIWKLEIAVAERDDKVR